MIRNTARKFAPLFAASALLLGGMLAAQPRSGPAIPAAEPGFERVVIQLPAKRDERLWQVELYAGKVMEVDCNARNFGENLIARETPYDYIAWTVNPDARVMSTMMGCPNNSKRMAFVSGRSVKTDYNSRIPIAIYAPVGTQVRYRLWSVTGREMIMRPN